MTSTQVNIRQVRRHFSSHAEEYDRYAVVQRRVVSRLVEMLASGDSVSGPVLDIGTGTGALAWQLNQVHPGLPLVVCDLAHGMTLHAAAVLPRAQALDADAQALPFGDDSFGLIASASVYQWVNDLPAAFVEAARVLAPGGRLAIALFGGRTLFELRESHRQAIAEAGAGHPSHAQEFPDRAEVGRALKTAGLADIRVLAADEVEWHPDVPALLRSLKKIGAQNASSDRPAGLSPRRVMQRMMQIYGQSHGRDGAVPATYEVIYALARKPACP